MSTGISTTLAQARSLPGAAGWLAALLLSMLLAENVFADDEAVGGVAVSGAWVRAMPPGQRMTAAYLTVTNLEATTVTLDGVTFEHGQASLHETRVVDGRSSMRPVAQLDIPPAGSVSLQPGGLHIMLMGLDTTPAEGEVLQLCLHTSAGQTCFDAPVLRSPDSPHTARHHSH